MAQMDGDQKLANLNKLVQYIYDFESTSSSLMSDLLDNLYTLINDETKETEAVITAEEDKVKILTYHSAKGMEFPVVILPLLERRFRYHRDVLHHKNFGFAVDLDQSLRKGNKKPFIYQFLQQQNQKMVQAEEKRLLYVAATRSKDYLFLTGSIKKNSQSLNLNYLNWIFQSYNIPLEKILDGDTGKTFYQDLGFKLQPHFIGDDYQHPDPDSYKGLSRELKRTIEDVKVLDYQKSFSEKPNLQVYSVTQLMLFREDKGRYFHHFYLNSGELLPPHADLEFRDEPGGTLWGTAVHRLLENFHLRDPNEDKLKIQQILMELRLPEEKKKLVFTHKLNDIIENFRKSDLSQKISESVNHSEFAIDLKIGNFILRGIFDNLRKDLQGFWEVIDYKTNKIKSGDLDRIAKKYSFQMQAYAILLSAFAPQQAICPISIFFLEPMKAFRKEYTLLEIESARTEITQLLDDIFTHEKRLFRTQLFEV
jgi:ATP-dependent exoDNAse (exonuclease V) beta subunit